MKYKKKDFRDLMEFFFNKITIFSTSWNSISDLNGESRSETQKCWVKINQKHASFVTVTVCRSVWRW